MSFLSYRTPPKVPDKSALDLKRTVVSDSTFSIGDNWLRKNRFGLWEAKLTGLPFEIGAKYGILAKELIQNQEIVFVNEFSKAVPGKFKQFFLKHLDRTVQSKTRQTYSFGILTRNLRRVICELKKIQLYSSRLPAGD